METEDKTTETQETKDEEAQKQWDAERQRADQAESVAEKAREEARTYAEELGETKARLEMMESQLKKFQTETQNKEDALAAMDDTLIDSSIIKNVEKLNQRDNAFAKEIEDLRKKLNEYEVERKERVRQEAIANAREEILSDCDSEFSPKYRTKALELADELVDSEKEKQPQDKYSGYKLMRKCYKQVAEEEEAKTKKTFVSVDDGKGGVSHTEQKRKEGTMQEVLADMKKDKSWMTG